MALSKEAVDSVLNAMNIISAAQLNNISYDKTIICTITDNSHAEKEGYYTVTNGSVRFKAYVTRSEDMVKYRINEQVYVKVPNGDYSQQKIIEGYYVAENEIVPVTYVSPLDSFLGMNEITAEREVGIIDGLIANDTINSEIALWQWSTNPEGSTVDDLQANDIYDTLGIQASFKCLLDKYKMYRGSYGLRLDLYVRLNPTSNKHITKSIYLDSSEMFGNPYAFTLYTTQAKTVNISEIGIIDGMTLYLYQNNDFVYYANGVQQRVPLEPMANILVKDIYIAFGSEITTITDNTIKLYNTEGNSFNFISPDDSSNTKHLGFLWYNKTDASEYIGFSDGVVDIAEQLDDQGNPIVDEEGNTQYEIVPYDELKYIEESAMESRLTEQAAKNVPTDKNGLEMSANISEAESIFSQAVRLVQVNLTNTLSDLYTRTKGLVNVGDISHHNYFNESASGKVNIAKNYGQSLEAKYKALIEWYKNALGAAAAIQKHQSEQTTPEEEVVIEATPTYSDDNIDNRYSVLKAEYEAFKANYYSSEIVLDDLRIEINSNYNAFQSIYDTYSNKIHKIFETLDKYFIKDDKEKEEDQGLLGNLLANNESRVTSSNKADADDSAYQYTLKKTIIKYEERDFSNMKNRYCVYWYRHEPGYIDEEGIMETGWKRLKENDEIQSGVMNTFIMPQNLGLPQKYIQSGSTYYLEKKPDAENSYLTVYLDPQRSEERFKVVIFYNHEKFVSNELVFTNADEVVDTATADANGAISISHGQNSMDSYQTLYGSNNLLINQGHASVNRELQLSYQGLLGGNEVLAGASVYWYVPRNSTMLSVNATKLIAVDDETKKPEFGSDYYRTAKVVADPGSAIVYTGPGTGYAKAKDNENKEISYAKDTVIQSIYDEKNSFYSLKSSNSIGYNGQWINANDIELIDNEETYMNGYACFYKQVGINEDGSAVKTDLLFEYKIKNYYVPTALNNTIFCLVKKDGYTFETSISMIFGTQGTSGTDYTILVQPIGTQLAANESNTLLLDVMAFDYNNNEIDIINNSILTDSSILYDPQVKWRGPSVYELAFTADEAAGNAINSAGVSISQERAGVYTYTEGQREYPNYCGLAEIAIKLSDKKYGSGKELSVIYPIAYTTDSYYIEGPTSVIYDSSGGNPAYYKEPYRIYDTDTNQEITDVRWDIRYFMQAEPSYSIGTSTSPVYVTCAEIVDYVDQINTYKLVKNEDGTKTATLLTPIMGTNLSNADKEINAILEEAHFYHTYMPKLDSKENKLIPANTYMGEVHDDDLGYIGYLNAYPVVFCYKKDKTLEDGTIEKGRLMWAQPIIITQNRYPNAMVNSWDGSFKIDDKNGTIMANMIGAGYKNTDNTYSGVLMGEVEGAAADNKSDVGIYGFHHGAQSFGLNIDGTAFFGKSGRGRILIDGNSGTIKSASYSQGLDSGMKIDLDDGVIDMRGIAKVGTPDSSILSNAQLGIMELGSAKTGLAPSASGMTEEEFNSLPDDDELFGQYSTWYEYRKDVGLLTLEEWNNDKGEYNTYRDYLEATIGKVKSYKQSRVHIDVQSPYFTIHSSNQVQRDKHIIHIANDAYYLQSDNYIEAQYSLIDGITIDEDGYLYKKEVLTDVDGNIVVDINGDIVYKIIYVNAEGIEQSSVINYTDINGNEINQVTGTEKTLGRGEGTKIDLQTGKFDAYNLLFTSKNIYLDSTENADPFFVVRDDHGHNLIYAGTQNYYLKTCDYSPRIADENNITTQYGSGMKIDLYQNQIEAYNFNLRGESNTDPTAGSYLLLDSTKPELTMHLIDSVKGLNLDLLKITPEEYYLHSSNYRESGVETITISGVRDATCVGGTYNVRSGPGLSYGKITTLAKGSEVIIYAEQEAAQDDATAGQLWFKIDYTLDRWVNEDAFKEGGTGEITAIGEPRDLEVEGVEIPAQGVDFNLTDGYLKFYHTDTTSLFLDSTAQTYPMQVGIFKVDWNGGIKGGSKFDWSVKSDGVATFNKGTFNNLSSSNAEFTTAKIDGLTVGSSLYLNDATNGTVQYKPYNIEKFPNLAVQSSGAYMYSYYVSSTSKYLYGFTVPSPRIELTIKEDLTLSGTLIDGSTTTITIPTGTIIKGQVVFKTAKGKDACVVPWADDGAYGVKLSTIFPSTVSLNGKILADSAFKISSSTNPTTSGGSGSSVDIGGSVNLKPTIMVNAYN